MAVRGGQNYRRRRLRGRIVFTLCLVVAIIVFFAGQANDRVLERTKTTAESGVSPILAYVTMPVRGFENFVSGVRDRGRAHQENKRLKTELARLSDIEARANALSIKLSRFETILNVDVSSGIPEQKIAARAVSENNGPFVRSVLINAGRDKGIKTGYSVMTVDGLLGHVVRAGRTSSRVLRLEDLNSRISVMSVRSQSRAILTGDNTRRPKLSFITEGSDWAEGDIVITSGDDGILPQGLPVGYVKADKDGDLRADLYVNDNHIDWVWVYPFEPVSAPGDEVDVQNQTDMDAQTQTGSDADKAIEARAIQLDPAEPESRQPEPIDNPESPTP